MWHLVSVKLMIPTCMQVVCGAALGIIVGLVLQPV